MSAGGKESLWRNHAPDASLNTTLNLWSIHVNRIWSDPLASTGSAKGSVRVFLAHRAVPNTSALDTSSRVARPENPMNMLFAMLATALASEVPLLTPDQQRQDFDEMWAALDHMHPSLYLHTAEEEFQRIREEVRARLDEPRSPGGYWTVIMDALTPIGCGHTTIYPSHAALDAIEHRHFPRDLVVLQGALYVDPRSHEDAGRVVSIQGVPVAEVLERIHDHGPVAAW